MNDLKAAIEEIAKEAARETIQHLESRIRFLEAQRQLPELLDTKQVAAMLGVHEVTVKRWRNGTPVIRFIEYPGGVIRYRREEVERFLSSRERGKRSQLRAA